MSAVPLSTRPLVTVIKIPLGELRSRSPFKVTPSKVPVTAKSCAPPLGLTIALRNVPPLSTQEPVVASRARIPPPRSNVPVRFTVPPERLRMPSLAGTKLPPRLRVELVKLSVPALFQAPLKLMAELLTASTPALVQVPLSTQVELLPA